MSQDEQDSEYLVGTSGDVPDVYHIPVRINSPLIDPKIPYTDEKATEPVPTRFPKTQVQVMDYLNQQEGIPFESRSNFIRASVFHYSQVLIEAFRIQHPALQRRVLEMRLATNAHDAAEWEYKRQLTMIDVHNYIVSLINQMAISEIYRILDEYFEYVNRIPIAHWRNNYRQAITNLTSVRLAILLLQKSGMGLPPEYLRGMKSGNSNTTGHNGTSGDSSDRGVHPGDEPEQSHDDDDVCVRDDSEGSGLSSEGAGESGEEPSGSTTERSESLLQS